MNIKIYLIGSVFTFLSFSAVAQNDLKGRIINEKDNAGIAGATIYISDLKLGAVSDAEGNFIFKNMPQGTFLAQIVHVGFASQTRELNAEGSPAVDFTMKESFVQLADVIVTGSPFAVEIQNTPVPVAVVAQKKVEPKELLTPGALILCGERIQDPRNVGVLIRTADALGCSGLLLSADSAEPWQRQAVRSTTGSILRLPVALAENLPAALYALREQGATVVSSSGSAEKRASDADLSVRPLILVVGNEGDGITEGVRAASDAVVKLPMAENTGADSLNVTVAAGMLLYEAIRRGRKRRGKS